MRLPVSRKILVLLLTYFLLMPAYSGTEEIIVLANPQEPFKYSENGIIKGIDIEILDHAMNRLGTPYHIMLIDSDARILEEAKKGRADILLLFSKNESRLEYLNYPDESYIDLTWNFFIRKNDSRKIHFDTLKDLRNLKTGATLGVTYTPEFFSSGLNLDVIVQNHLQIKKLLNGRIDTVPLNTINALYSAKKTGEITRLSYLPKPLKSKPYYNVFPKASRVLDQPNLIKRYDQAIRDMKQDGTIETIFKKYLGDSLAGKLDD